MAAPTGATSSRERSRASAAIITVSTSRALHGGEDESGDCLAAFAARLGLELAGRDLIADERVAIEERLRYWCDGPACALVLTTGGTGLAPSDVTPEATRAVVERDVPGLGEAMREASRAHTPNWMLSRALAGIRGRTLILNFPGSPRSIEQIGEAIAPALPHALALIAGSGGH